MYIHVLMSSSIKRIKPTKSKMMKTSFGLSMLRAEQILLFLFILGGCIPAFDVTFLKVQN
jgi:hypothetical protein